jgi:hypothetical protein
MRSKLPLVLLLSAVRGLSFQASGDPQAVLKRMFDVTGFGASGKVLHWHDIQGVEQNYQSAPPFATVFQSRESWFDPESGVERSSSQSILPSHGPGQAVTSLGGPLAMFAVGASGPTPVAGSPTQLRDLNLWAVLADWRGAHDVRLLPDQSFQDYPRTVLARNGALGEERLFVDPKTGFPVKLERQEPHYLWGQVLVEYIYSQWNRASGRSLPMCSARMVDGFKEITRTIGNYDFVDRGETPALNLPAASAPASGTDVFLQPLPPKKYDVDAHTFLSRNVGYAEGFALIGDTVYIFDATQGEERARQDLAMIQTAFPGAHRLAVVVTDLAWPHIAGVRFWVANGATVISHRASREFLMRVIERRWTLHPDQLEQRRKDAAFKFIAVDKTYSAEGGKLQLSAIDGIDTEGALIAYLPDSGFLWGSDYVQNTTRPSAYATQVWQAVQRAGFTPKNIAAMHIPITPWNTIEKLAQPDQ